MKPMQYIIKNLDNGLLAKWNDDVILFDSQEEAKEFIETFPDFFEKANFELSKGIYFIDNSINYKDIPKESINEELEERR